MGKFEKRGMERDQDTVIFWRNEGTTCKVVFTVYNGDDPEVFLLVRTQIWKSGDKIYGIPMNTTHELSKEEGRELWNTLVDYHKFKRIGFERQEIHTDFE